MDVVIACHRRSKGPRRRTRCPIAFRDRTSAHLNVNDHVTAGERQALPAKVHAQSPRIRHAIIDLRSKVRSTASGRWLAITAAAPEARTGRSRKFRPLPKRKSPKPICPDLRLIAGLGNPGSGYANERATTSGSSWSTELARRLGTSTRQWTKSQRRARLILDRCGTAPAFSSSRSSFMNDERASPTLQAIADIL